MNKLEIPNKLTINYPSQQQWVIIDKSIWGVIREKLKVQAEPKNEGAKTLLHQLPRLFRIGDWNWYRDAGMLCVGSAVATLLALWSGQIPETEAKIAWIIIFAVGVLGVALLGLAFSYSGLERQRFDDILRLMEIAEMKQDEDPNKNAPFNVERPAAVIRKKEGHWVRARETPIIKEPGPKPDEPS